MPMLTTGEATIYYQYDAQPQKPVLVLSNSLGTTLSMWEPQLEAFGQHFSLLRYDARGHGQSSLPAGPYTIEQLSRDVLALLDELKIAKAHFCGISMGGMVGQWLGANAPERLLKLVLADTAPQCGGPEFWNMNIDNARQGGMVAAAPMITGAWFTDGFRAAHPELVERTIALVHATPPEGFAACCAAIRDMDQQATTASIQAPTLVIYGKHDFATPPEASKFLLSQIAGSEELVLDAAHISNLEAPEAFTQGVLEFLLRR